MKGINNITTKQRIAAYIKDPLSLLMLAVSILSALLTLFIFVSIVGYIFVKGIPFIKPDLFAKVYTTENVSLYPAMINTVIMAFLSLIVAAPVGVFSSIFLVEYAKRGSIFTKIVRRAAETLSGIPSIIYGLFGMLFFVSYLKWGYSILAGSFTLVIMILPLIMRTTEEALRSVPDSYREGSFGLGAGKLRTVFVVVLPSAIPGIFAGVVLSIGRIVGETAALIYTAGTVAQIPKTLLRSGRTLSVHMWALYSEGLYTNQSYATAVILIVIVVLINSASAILARKLAKGWQSTGV